MNLKRTAQDYLSHHPYEVGESVELGWFIFRIAARSDPPRLESLDFRKMASFTEDFSEPERIFALQVAALANLGVSESPCNLQQVALVSAGYVPGHDRAFLERQQIARNNDSGWYVGILDDTKDMDDPESFVWRSLYELTIHDMRMAPFWLLPPGTVVPLSQAAIESPSPSQR